MIEGRYTIVSVSTRTELKPRLVERRVKVGVDEKGYDVFTEDLILEKNPQEVKSYLIRDNSNGTSSFYTEEQAIALLGRTTYQSEIKRMV